MWERNHTEAGPTCQPLIQKIFEITRGPEKEARRQCLDTDIFHSDLGGEEEKKGEELQGKEGMSWMNLSTGWRAPR
jgi:hypothetical protein